MQSYKEQQDLEIIKLKEIINETFSVDVCNISRKREIIDAKKIYSKILRDRGYSYETIGQSINKNHATILHYMSSIDFTLTYDKVMTNKYIFCKKIFLNDLDELPIKKKRMKDKDIFMTVARLNVELQEAISDKKQILTKFVDCIEKYEKEKGYYFNSEVLKKVILPLFNE